MCATRLSIAGVSVALALFALPAMAGKDLRVRVRTETGIVSIPLEVYVERVVAAETYADWPAEALKAQAVVARSYVLHEKARNAGGSYDVVDSVRSQRYRATPVPATIRAAVAATRGWMLTHEGRPILAAFHASAGGRTASAAEVWGEAVSYLRGVPSPDDGAPDFFWSFEIARADLVAALTARGFQARIDGEFGVLERGPSGRVRTLRLGGAPVEGRTLRRILGGRALRSTLFELRVEGDRIQFLGSGSGHGVGLSQWGTRALAQRGKSYREILAHYYPGTHLVRVAGAGEGPRVAGRAR
ncbi:MAG: SpoIID/LytB domain-containing protein [Myxococcota bacterium]